MEQHLANISAWAMAPFVMMLGAIAILPLFAEHFWEKNRNKFIVSLILSIPIIIYMISQSLGVEIYHTMVFDYVPFIILLGSLFIITGGIYVDGDIEAKPFTIVKMLALGAILASVMGTTGASMLLIRPVLHTIKERKYKSHIVLFFIGIVANCGGLLTPLGDPPLFMMYLRGAPFSWFFNLAPEWLFANALIIVIFWIVDTYLWKKEPENVKLKDKSNITPITIKGKINFVFMLGVVLAVAFVNDSTIPALGADKFFGFAREAVIIVMALLSLKFTSKDLRESNSFSWGPIEEVAYLFFGIFVTMVPCLLYLKFNAQTLGVESPMAFYYSSGALSSFLDNTPTAVTFHSLALGLKAIPGALTVAGIPEVYMKAICTGAVFFGSMSYIGNGPNFMVKSIAESEGVKMPHFFEYMYKFSLIVLLPTFILVHLLFIK